MIKISLNVTNIPKEKIFQGKKGKYLDLVLVDRPDDYGNDGFVSVDVSKAEREAGKKGAIVGNWKHVGQKPKQEPPKNDPRSRRPTPSPADPDLGEEDIPF